MLFREENMSIFIVRIFNIFLTNIKINIFTLIIFYHKNMI